MDRELQILLKKHKEFNDTAFTALREGDFEKSSFYYNLVASIAGQISDKLKG